jgi:predicted nucleotide-binding protein
VTTELLGAPNDTNTGIRMGKLRVPRDQAVGMLRGRLERGLEIKMLKVRNQNDLEKAREQKLEWTQQTNSALVTAFEDDSASEEFNKWNGKVLPEFAEVAQFIEQFYDEMEQRLRKLHGILKRLETEPDVVPRTESGAQAAAAAAAAAGAAAGTAAAIAAATAAAEAVAEAVAEEATDSVRNSKPAAVGHASNRSNAPHTREENRKMSGQTSTAAEHAAGNGAAAAAAAASRAASAAVRSAIPTRHTLLIVRQRNEQVEEAITQFVAKLNFEVSLVFDQQQQEGFKGLVAKLDKQPKITFAMVLATPEEVQGVRDNATGGGRSAFELGYCAGKLGFNRVCVLHTAPQSTFHDEYGMIYIPVDPADGWQLALGRHLKRAGIDVDMNRLC